MNRKTQCILAAILFRPILAVVAAPEEAAREPVIQIVSKIQRADYEGDRAALRRLYEELAPFADDKKLAARVRYWRGFAMWRRAINGFNEAIDPKELQMDLGQALDEFNEVKSTDPGFADARLGMVSCLGFLGYIHQKDAARAELLFAQIGPLAAEAKTIAGENPRLFWVFGPNVFVMPPDRGGGQDKAIAMYEKGLELSRKTKASEDRLEPSWGEAELLMSLAWSHLNKATPDVNAAERYARSALEIVPYWHYVRDILMPQIVAAKAKAK